MTSAQSTFGSQLRRWRRERGKTQLEVSYISGYSQRHVSFLESGRSRPSRATVITLAEALDVPVKERNSLLHAAGFAPAYTHAPIDGRQLEHAVRALDVVLQSHRPFPAIVVDRGWNTFAANDCAFALFQAFSSAPLAVTDATPINAIRMCLDPMGLRPQIRNWRDFVTSLLTRLRHELAFEGDDHGIRALVDAIESDAEYAAHRRESGSNPQSPVAVLSLERDGMAVDLFSLISTFGTPTDATLAELRVETFFPANERSREALQGLDASVAQSGFDKVPFAAWRRSSG